MRQRRRSYRERDDDEDDLSDDLAAVKQRLDDLTRQLAHMAQGNLAQSNAGAPARAGGAGSDAPDRVADALSRLDRRLDQIVGEGHEPEPRPRRARPQPQPAPQPASTGPASWAAQISARQHALEDDASAAPSPRPVPSPVPSPAPPPAPAPAAWAPGPDMSGLEQQLRQINNQIAALQQPYEDGLTALRRDLNEIGRALTEAMPRRAIEELESQVRALADRLDRSRQAGVDGTALAGLERGLAEVRDTLRELKPAESLVGFEDAVRGLAQKIDQIGASSQPIQDPGALRQLEQAVVSLRGVVSNVASDGALAQLAAEVRGLADRFERATAESSSDALVKLEARIASLMDSGRAVPPELEGSIRSLSERLDRLQLSKGDQLALESLEDRIAKLSEQLNAADARLGHLDAIERGIAELLVHLEEMRHGPPRAARPPSTGDGETRAAEIAEPRHPEPAPARRQSDVTGPSAPQIEVPLLQELAPPQAHAPAAVPAPSQLPQPMPVAQPPAESFAPPPAAQAFAPPQAARATMRPTPAQRPIDANLPPDTPLEPGSGAPRHRPGSAAARIAASEAAIGRPRSAAADYNAKAAAIAAARNAAKSAYVDTPVQVPKSMRPKRRSWFKRRPEEEPATLPEMHSDTPVDRDDDAGLSLGKRTLKHLKTLLIIASVAIIVVGTVQTAIDLLTQGEHATAPGEQIPVGAPSTPPPQSVPSRPMPTPQGPLPTAPAVDPDTTGQIGRPSPFFSSAPATGPKLPLVDITGSIPQQPIPQRPVAPRASTEQGSPERQPQGMALPAAFGPVLRTAALADDPAAQYEIGVRFAEARGVAQNLPEAARWLERAAGAGFAPAQFRLAGFNEKGEGVKKDLQAARRLYLAAADQGHAKAMHNLAVLHAEGIDGKPDYKTAAQWFRKAASHGIADSQYNLGILYARGIGVETNLAESYKWFALSAGHGDPDAAKKRDEVASRLNQQTLTAARLAAQTFTARRERPEATDLRVPAGGWDRAAAPQARATRRIPTSNAR